MTKEQCLEKLVAILAKQTLPDAIETYHLVGSWLHDRIDGHQKKLGEELNQFQTEKEKIKH